MTQREWLLAGLVCMGVALGILVAWLSTGRSRGFRNRLLKDLEAAALLPGGLEKRLIEIAGNREKWKKSVTLIRKPFSMHVNLAIESAAMIYALVGLVNAMVHFEKYFDSPAQGYWIMIFFGVILGCVPSEHLLSGRVEKEMDALLVEMQEAIELKRSATFLDRARKEWK
jgi:hypothetical protein